MSEPTTVPPNGAEYPRWTVDEVAELTGVSVRNTRYYASRGLLPAPERVGRVAYYGIDHVARLRLIQALQDHGFTLAAVERYLASLPEDSTAEDLALRRVLLTSWTELPPAQDPARLESEVEDLGLPTGAMNAATAAIDRHMSALADDLTVILRDQVLVPFRQGSHSAAEKAEFEQTVARLRELTLQAVVAGFQRSADDVISRSLHREAAD